MKFTLSLVGVVAFSWFVLIQCSTLATAASVATTTVTTTLEGRIQFPDDNKSSNSTTGTSSPPPPTRITLNHGEYMTYVRSDGTFKIYNVPPGVHQLDVDSSIYHFGQIKIQVLEDSMDTPPKCLEYAFPGAPKKAIKYPLVLSPRATKEYFMVKKGFSILSMLKNPMVLMMIFSAGMMFMMPKMMEGLDPEEKARMKQQMQAQQDPTKMLSQMWGEITGGDEPPTNSSGGSGATRKDQRRGGQQSRR